MNWNRRSAWIRKDETPDYQKATAYGVDVIYVDPNSSNATEVVAEILAHGFNAGICEATGWYDTDPVGFVQVVKQHVRSLIPQAYPFRWQARGAPVMLDLEPVDYEWTRTMVLCYRLSLPVRETSFTTEPWKADGRILPFTLLRLAQFHWYVQTYYQDMTPVEDQEWLMLSAARAMPSSDVHAFYGYQNPPVRDQDGCLFTLLDMP